jgi:hypothetical protein
MITSSTVTYRPWKLTGSPDHSSVIASRPSSNQVVPNQQSVPASLLGQPGRFRDDPRIGEITQVRDVDRAPHVHILDPCTDTPRICTTLTYRRNEGVDTW